MNVDALKKIGLIVLAGMMVAAARAADPAVSVPAVLTNASELKDLDKLSPDDALAKAREFRKRAEAGDADATFGFAMLLSMHGPSLWKRDSPHASEWQELGDNKPPGTWLDKAADGGSQYAIRAICRMGEDALAPAALREKSQERCEALKAKFPGK